MGKLIENYLSNNPEAASIVAMFRTASVENVSLAIALMQNMKPIERYKIFTCLTGLHEDANWLFGRFVYISDIYKDRNAVMRSVEYHLGEVCYHILILAPMDMKVHAYGYGKSHSIRVLVPVVNIYEGIYNEYNIIQHPSDEQLEVSETNYNNLLKAYGYAI